MLFFSYQPPVLGRSQVVQESHTHSECYTIIQTHFGTKKNCSQLLLHFLKQLLQLFLGRLRCGPAYDQTFLGVRFRDYMEVYMVDDLCIMSRQGSIIEAIQDTPDGQCARCSAKCCSPPRPAQWRSSWRWEEDRKDFRRGVGVASPHDLFEC